MENALVDFISTIKLTPGQINESIQNNDGRLIIKDVVLQRAEALNRNKRVYPREILEREDTNFRKLIKENRAFGELDHPESAIISLKNVSHDIIDTRWKNNELIGDIQIFDSPSIPMGQLAAGILKLGKTLGVSSRGTGSTRQVQFEGQEANEVMEDYNLVGYDLVSNPSTINAILKENVINLTEDIEQNNINLLMNRILSREV